jgi:AcrR family transcriptional regulator
MTTAPKSRWRGVPADERQAERRSLLIDAGFELLGSNGLAGTTVRGVCEAARLNPRYFYESFTDLDALLVAVFDRTSVEALEVMIVADRDATAEAPDALGEDPLEVLKGGIGAFVRYLTDDPRRAQVLFVEGLGNEAISRRRLRSMVELADLLVAMAREGGGAVSDDPVFRVAAHVMVGGMAELLITWLQGELDIPLDQLVDDTARLFVATGATAHRIAVDRAPGPRARTRTTPKRTR